MTTTTAPSPTESAVTVHASDIRANATLARRQPRQNSKSATRPASNASDKGDAKAASKRVPPMLKIGKYSVIYGHSQRQMVIYCY